MAAKQDKKTRLRVEPTANAEGWSFAFRASLSVLIVWHVFVLFISPLSVQPSSPLVVGIAQSQWLRWYSDPLYINHGYHFFGPDPPIGGTVVRYKVWGDDGREVAQGEFPDLKDQWPRLWYHRHMMLADQMTGVSVYGDPQRDRDVMLRAYARHLLRKYDGAEARVEAVFHRSLHPGDVRGDLDPNAPPSPADPFADQFYESLQTVVQRSSDLEAPLLPDAALPTFEPERIPIGVGG